MPETEGLQRWLDEREMRYQERFVALERTLAVALASAEKAVLKAENANEKRFESQNEFRGTLGDQARTLMPRAEVEALMTGVSEKIKRLEDAQIANTGLKTGVAQLISYAIAAAGVLVAIAALAFR